MALALSGGVWEWIEDVQKHALEDEKLAALVCGLAEACSHLLSLPNPGFIAPLAPHMDSVSMGLGAALGAVSPEDDANAALAQTYRFLGGRFVDDARYPVTLPGTPAPESRLARWRWFCEGTQAAAATADTLWRRVMDPVQ